MVLFESWWVKFINHDLFSWPDFHIITWFWNACIECVGVNICIGYIQVNCENYINTSQCCLPLLQCGFIPEVTCNESNVYVHMYTTSMYFWTCILDLSQCSSTTVINSAWKVNYVHKVFGLCVPGIINVNIRKDFVF